MKDLQELKELIKEEAIILKNYVFFCVLVDGSKTVEELKRLCLKYKLLYSLELFEKRNE